MERRYETELEPTYQLMSIKVTKAHAQKKMEHEQLEIEKLRVIATGFKTSGNNKTKK